MPDVATKIGSLPWIEDGIGRTEFNAVRGLFLVVNEGYSAILVDQPWLVAGINHAALESLWMLALNRPEEFNRIMSHPTVSDGVTAQEAKIVATLHRASPDLLDKLLDPQQVTLEERIITLPLAGEAELSIIRTHPGTERTMDVLEHSVRSIEEFMALPFPRRQVIYMFEGASPEGPAGRNSNTHVSILRDEQTVKVEYLPSLLAHEAGHYYWTSVWTGATRWILEGAAEFLASMAEDSLNGPVTKPPCIPARTISELENLARDPKTSGGALPCHYSLGERLFRDLYKSLDDTTFRLALRRLFQRLYQHTLFEEPGDECRTASSHICHVKAAFTTGVPGETAATVEGVVARWYDGTEPYDLSSIDGTPVDAAIRAIDRARRGGTPEPPQERRTSSLHRYRRTPSESRVIPEPRLLLPERRQSGLPPD